MYRFWFLPALFLAGCASSSVPDTHAVYPDGRVVALELAAPEAQTSSAFDTAAIETTDIDAALLTYLGPEGDNLILLPNRLDKSALDYSVDSLKAIDTWLADVHTINRLQAGEGQAGELLMMDGRGDNSVMFAGLYLGEVIRANSSLTWNWERFDRFLSANPAFAEHYGADPGFDTFVLVGPQGVSTPINTALKRVVHGKEESVYYIGTLLLNEVDLQKAMSGRDLLGMDQRDWGG